MPLLTHAVISVQEGKDEINLGINDKIEVAAAEEIINIVTEVLEGETGRKFVYRGATYTEYHTFREPTSVLWTIERPVTSLVEFKESASRDWDNVAALVVDKDFVLSPRTGQIERLSSGFSGDLLDAQREWWPSGVIPSGHLPFFQMGARANRIKYQAGAANTAAVSRKVKDVARQLFARKWKEIKRGAQGVTSWTDEAGNFTRLGPVRLTPEMREELKGEYRYPQSKTGQQDA